MSVPTFKWKFVIRGGTNEIDRTKHTLYVTYGAPSPVTDLTPKRIEFVVNAANGATAPVQIADGLYDALEDSPPYFNLTNSHPPVVWYLMNGSEYTGQCIDLAKLMKQGYDLLGGGGAVIGYVYGSTDSACFSTYDDAFETRTCPGGVHGTEILEVYSAGDWNRWEAVCVISPDHYYAIKVSSARSPLTILRDWLGNNALSGNHQSWLYLDAIGVHACETPGPNPVPKP